MDWTALCSLYLSQFKPATRGIYAHGVRNFNWSEDARRKAGERLSARWEAAGAEERKARSKKMHVARANAQIPRSSCVACRREMQTFQLRKHLGSKRCTKDAESGMVRI